MSGRCARCECDRKAAADKNYRRTRKVSNLSEFHRVRVKALNRCFVKPRSMTVWDINTMDRASEVILSLRPFRVSPAALKIADLGALTLFIKKKLRKARGTLAPAYTRKMSGAAGENKEHGMSNTYRTSFAFVRLSPNVHLLTTLVGALKA